MIDKGNKDAEARTAIGMVSAISEKILVFRLKEFGTELDSRNILDNGLGWSNQLALSKLHTAFPGAAKRTDRRNRADPHKALHRPWHRRLDLRLYTTATNLQDYITSITCQIYPTSSYNLQKQ